MNDDNLDSQNGAQSAVPFTRLQPEIVLDALDALDTIGIRGDGRMLALNSYENRVYQVGVEDGPPVVAKFYRPIAGAMRRSSRSMRSSPTGRARVPAVPARALDGRTLHDIRRLPLRDLPRHGGRAPDLDGAHARVAGPLHRAHPCGRAAADFRERPTLDLETLRRRAARLPARAPLRAGRLRAAWEAVVDHALEGVARAFERPAASARCACTATAIRQRAVDRRGPAFRRLRRRRMGPAMQDLWMLLSGDRARRRAAGGSAHRLRALPPVRSARAASDRGVAHAAPDPLQRGSRGAGTTPHFPPRFRGSTRSATGRPHPRTARADRRDAGRAALAGVSVSVCRLRGRHGCNGRPGERCNSRIRKPARFKRPTPRSAIPPAST